MPSQQMLEEEAKEVQDYIHQDEHVDNIITVGSLEEEQAVDHQEQLNEELQRIKDVIVENEGVDIHTRQSLERYVSLESEHVLPMVNSYTGELSMINYDTTLTWVNNRLEKTHEELLNAKLCFLRAAITWISNSLEQAELAKVEARRLQQVFFKRDDSCCDAITKLELDDMFKASGALLNFARTTNVPVDEIDFITSGRLKALNAKRRHVKDITNAALVRHINGYIYNGMINPKYDNTMNDKFALCMFALGKVCDNLEYLKQGEIKGFNVVDIDTQALKQCELSSVIYGGTISTSVVSLMLEPIADKFARNHLIYISPYELIEDITALKDIDTKIPDSIDVSNINFLSMLDQINTILSAIMEGLIPCYDNLNKVIEYLTVREQVQTAFLMYADEVREATTA